jgi:hypothetical protein
MSNSKRKVKTTRFHDFEANQAPVKPTGRARRDKILTAGGANHGTHLFIT